MPCGGRLGVGLQRYPGRWTVTGRAFTKARTGSKQRKQIQIRSTHRHQCPEPQIAATRPLALADYVCEALRLRQCTAEGSVMAHWSHLT